MDLSAASSSIRSSRSHEPSSSSSSSASGSLLLTPRSNTGPPPSPSSSSSPATAWRWKEAEVEELIARLERSVVHREKEEASRKDRGGVLVVKDRRWRFRWYPQCFTGVELVDWLLAHEEGPPFCVRTREEAVALGQHLMDQEWITHVVNDREFFDKGFFYQFRMKKKLLTNAGLVSGNGEANLDLGRIAVAMINNVTGVPVQDRRWRLKKYPNCFIGKEAADWMSAHLNVDREAAIRVLQQLHKEGLFYHVTNDHTYKDAELFYVFSKQFPSSLSLPLVRDTYWIEWEELDIIQTISQGSDAIVYKGLWCGEEVAIKVVSLPSPASTTNDPRKIEHDQTSNSQPPTMTKTNNSGGGFRFSRTKSTLIRDRSTARVAMLEALDEFKNEIWILSGLHHPNIVSMKGICRNPYAVITEWLPCGDLYRFLHSSDSEDSFLPWSIIWKIAFDIAQGMAYLHSKDIVHSDLKSPNCLVSCLCEDSIAVKIADFGLSDRIISKTMQLEKDQQTASTQKTKKKKKNKSDEVKNEKEEEEEEEEEEKRVERLEISRGSQGVRSKDRFSSSERKVTNPIWLAPEVLDATKDYDGKAADCYAFGVILYEAITRQDYFSELRFFSQIEDAVLSGERPKNLERCFEASGRYPPKLKVLVERCWSQSPTQRPSFQEVCEELKEMMEWKKEGEEQ